MPLSNLIISSIPDFASLDERYTDIFAQSGSLVQCSAGSLIVAQQQPFDFLIVPLTGHVRAIQAGPDNRNFAQIELPLMEPLGWLNIIDGGNMPYSLVAATDASIALLPGAVAKEALLHQPLLAVKVFRTLARLARQHIEERRILSVNSAFQRVFVLLQKISESPTNPGEAPQLPKQQAIADHLNTSRETVSRALQFLLKQGVLVKKGHQFFVHQPDRLAQLATLGPKANDKKSS